MSDSQRKEVHLEEKTEKNNNLEKTNIFKLCGIDNSEIDLSFQSPQIKSKKSNILSPVSIKVPTNIFGLIFITRVNISLLFCISK